MIDIIMPVYNARNTLFVTLSSIAFQSIKDKIIVHIVDDGSFCNYDDIIEKFTKDLVIKFYRLENNVGPGVARQYLLDRTSSEYICFMDSDDLFFTYDSLELLYNSISLGNDYVLGTVFNERNGISCYTESDLHGKLYRRSFILNNNIFFPNTRVHEDNVFNNLVRLNNPKIGVVSVNVYVYCNNTESITSVDEETEFKRLKILVDNTDLVITTAIKSKCIEYYIKQFIYEKTKYFSRRYKLLSNEKKEVLKSLIDNSLLDSNYLFTDDYVKLKENIFAEDISKYFCKD